VVTARIPKASIKEIDRFGESRGCGSITTASAATTTTAVAAASTAAAAATVSATATATRFAGLGLVDREATAVDFLVMKTLDGGLGLSLAAHLDKAEALAPTGVAILDDLRALHDPEPGEQLLQVGVADLVGQVPDIQFPAHVNLQEQGRDPSMISRVGTNLGRLGRPIRREGERGRRGQNPNGLRSRAPSDSDHTIISILRPRVIGSSGLLGAGDRHVILTLLVRWVFGPSSIDICRVPRPARPRLAAGAPRESTVRSKGVLR
jgi:hypothetical protein